MNRQRQQLKQQMRDRKITRILYQSQLTPLKKKIFEVEQTLKCMAKKELSELLAGVFNPLGDTGFVTFDDVVEFVNGEKSDKK